jgi:enediyne polyketide synthase
MGVLPIGTHAGAAAYVDLVDRSPGDSSFVITSRLTADLEKLLYAPAPACRGRFLEAIRRRVPGTELVADAFLSHETDPYLSEHVFEGTPILPGVMAIEAMVEAAKAVTGRSDLPVVRNIEFQRPVVVPVGAATTVRTLAQADPARPQRANVRVAIRSSADRFARDHVTAECLWDEADDVPDPLPVLGQLPEPLPIDPESLHPTPLFQGELFRRIRTFRTLTHPSKLAADAVASLAEISVPRQERYYETPDEYTNETPSPIARDACLQAGAASLPAGYLPTRLSELRFYGTAAPGERLSCKATVRRATSDAIRVDLEVFDGRQRLLETITGLELSRPRSHDESADRAVKPTRCSGPVRIASDLEALLGTEPVALGFSVTSDAVRGKSDESAARACSTAKLTATRSALLRFASRLGARPPHPEELAVGHEPSGRPEILAAGEADRIFAGADLSISDSGGMSVAAVGTTRLGIDIEAVEARDAPVWRGLLGSDGYALALEFSRLSDEPFDIAATRIWTLLEAGGKAIGEGHLIPAYESALGSTWHAFGARVDGRVLEYLCTLLEPVASGPPLALSLARVVTSVGRPSARSRPRTGGGHVALNTK